MKRIIITGTVAAIAAISFAGTASAAPDQTGPACFGQVHKVVNAEPGFVAGIENVGQLMKEVIKGNGQDKKLFVNDNLC